MLAILKKLGLSMEQINNMSIPEIINILKENTEAVKNINTQVGDMLALINEIKPYLGNYSNELAAFFQQVVNSINNNGQDIQDAINSLKPILEQIKAQIDQILKKMDAALDQGLLSLQKYDEIIELLKNPRSLSSIEALLNQLINKTEESNNYLAYLPQISQQIAELEAKAGRGLTKEELADVLNSYGNNMYERFTMLLNGYHADDMAKFDEIIGYLKKGNEINMSIYNMIDAWKNSVDLTLAENKEMLRKIYEYLPNLKCNCQCQGDIDNNEGIQGNIDDLLN